MISSRQWKMVCCRRHFIDRSQRPRPWSNGLSPSPDSVDKLENGRQILRKSFTASKATCHCLVGVARESHCFKMYQRPWKKCFNGSFVCHSHGVLNWKHFQLCWQMWYFGELVAWSDLQPNVQGIADFPILSIDVQSFGFLGQFWLPHLIWNLGWEYDELLAIKCWYV